jgi:hypothetical protein
MSLSAAQPELYGKRAAVVCLAAEFPAFTFTTQRSRSGTSLVAVRRSGASEPGLYVVVTPDPAEMRDALSS